MTAEELFRAMLQRGADDPSIAPILKYVDIKELGNLVHLRYTRFDQIFGAEGEEYVNFWDSYGGVYRELRSCVFDKSTGEYVLRPFRKFFNVGEMDETSYDIVRERIANATMVEYSNKLDGSMVSASFYKGEIVVATSSAIDPANSWRLEDAYRQILSDENYVNLIKACQGRTLMFEYLDPKDVHVVKYGMDDYGLHLIGMVRNSDGYEYPYSYVTAMASANNVKTTEVYDDTFDNIWNSLDTKLASEAEGFVINIDGWKVKLKYNDYVHIHNEMCALKAPKTTIKAIMEGNFDDLYAYAPEVCKERMTYYKSRLLKYCQDSYDAAKDWYENVKGLPIKEAMIIIHKEAPHQLRGTVVSMYKGQHTDPLDFLKSSGGYRKWNEIFPDEKIN